MKGKYKLTRFARFVIFLMIISPACYFVGNHFQYDPTIFDWKEKFNIEWSFADSQDETEVKVEEIKAEIKDIKETIEDLESELAKKEFKIKELKKLSNEA